MANDLDDEARARLVRRIARPYAHALVIKADGLMDLALTTSQRQTLKSSMKEDLHKCGDALVPELVPY